MQVRFMNQWTILTVCRDIYGDKDSFTKRSFKFMQRGFMYNRPAAFGPLSGHPLYSLSCFRSASLVASVLLLCIAQISSQTWWYSCTEILPAWTGLVTAALKAASKT